MRRATGVDSCNKGVEQTFYRVEIVAPLLIKFSNPMNQYNETASYFLPDGPSRLTNYDRYNSNSKSFVQHAYSSLVLGPQLPDPRP